MSTAVPDPREPKPCPRCGETCTHDGWGHVHPNGIGIGSCTVPDPRFRDQIAEVLWLAQPEYTVAPWDEISETTRERYRAKVDALMPVIAAEVEARVQAAANQRAADELEAEAAYDDAAPEEQYSRGLFARRLRVRAENLRADALASPASALDAES